MSVKFEDSSAATAHLEAIANLLADPPLSTILKVNRPQLVRQYDPPATASKRKFRRAPRGA